MSNNPNQFLETVCFIEKHGRHLDAHHVDKFVDSKVLIFVTKGAVAEGD